MASQTAGSISIQYNYFSCNGKVLPAAEAVVPLGSVEYSYGFGVYETIRASRGKALFLDEHAERLMESARIIGLEHPFTPDSVQKSVQELINKNEADSCNVKILLVGRRDKESANLYIMCLNPLYPDRKLYKTGAKVITQAYERPFPHAKTLNMLPSYLAYRAAKQAGAYDALLANREGNIIEGTRTNFFGLKGKTIISPPESDILLGVTRGHVLKVAAKNGFNITQKDIKLSDVGNYDGAFLTSTSAKIMPISSIDNHTWKAIPENLRKLMAAFDQFLVTNA